MNLPSQGQGLARYGAVNVTTSSPGQILIMLYDGLFRFLREAIAAMHTKDRSRVHERTARSLAILDQFLVGLDRSRFPALCDNLIPLYQFCMSQVTLANIGQDPALLEGVIKVLLPLRDAWAVAVEQMARESASKVAAGQESRQEVRTTG